MNYSKNKVFSDMPSVLLWAGPFALSVLLAFLCLIFPKATISGFGALLILFPLLLKPEYAVYFFSTALMVSDVLMFQCWGTIFKSIYLVLIVLMLSWLFARLANTRKSLSGVMAQQHIFYIFFICWATLSLLWRNNELLGYNMLLFLYINFCVLYIFANQLSNKDVLYRSFKLFIFMGIVNALVTLAYPYFKFSIKTHIQIVNNIDLILNFWTTAHRTAATAMRLGRTMGFSLPHYTSTNLILPIVCSIILFFVAKSRRTRTFLMLFAVVMFMAMISTLSKTPLISLGFGIVFVFFYIKPLKRFFITNMFWVFIVIVILFCMARVYDIERSFTGYLIDLKIVSVSSERVTSVGNRMGLIKLGMKVLVDTYGFGCGIGSFRPIARANGLTIDGSHPLVLFELGFVGFLLWWLPLISSYFLFMKTIKNTPYEYYRRMLIVYTGGYVAMLINWFFSATYVNIYLWFYLSIGYALVYMSTHYPVDDVLLPFHKPGESIVDI